MQVFFFENVKSTQPSQRKLSDIYSFFLFYKITEILRALWLVAKPMFYCTGKHREKWLRHRFRGSPTWRPESDRNICHWVLPLKRKIIPLECRHIESSTSSSARIVQLVKPWAITPLLTNAKALSGRHFNVTQRINLQVQTSSITKRRTLSSLNVGKR